MFYGSFVFCTQNTLLCDCADEQFENNTFTINCLVCIGSLFSLKCTHTQDCRKCVFRIKYIKTENPKTK